MRICLTKDGKFLEAQSHANPETLIQNAVKAGYKAKDVEERDATQEEVDALMEQLPEAIAAKELIETNRQADVDAINNITNVADVKAYLLVKS